MIKRVKRLKIVANIFFAMSFLMLCKGIDKLTRYRNTDYSHLKNINAYVGGDAYNYIINGNYTTAFFVLSMGFLIAGMISVVACMMAEAIIEGKEINEELPVAEKQRDETIERLEKLTELADKGVISEEEFQAKKKEILD